MNNAATLNEDYLDGNILNNKKELVTQLDLHDIRAIPTGNMTSIQPKTTSQDSASASKAYAQQQSSASNIAMRDTGGHLSKRTQHTHHAQQHQLAANVIKVNYNAVCDLERLEKFRDLVSTVANMKRIWRAFSTILTQCLEVINCQSGSIFMFKQDILDTKHMTEDLTI